MILNSNLKSHMEEKLPLYVFVSVLFMTGIAFGALMVNALSQQQIAEMSHFLSQFFQRLEHGSTGESNVFLLQAFTTHLKWVLLIGVLGISIIGLPIILILMFIKGVLLGFTVGYFVSQLSWKGMLFAMISIAPQNILVVPALIICSVSGISLSLFLIKKQLSTRQLGHAKQQFASYIKMIFSLIFILFVASLFEAFVTPVLMKWLMPALIV